MRACPFPCKDYRPPPEAERPEQEVHVLGGDWYRGRTCPAAVVAADPTVAEVTSDAQTMHHWATGSSLEWFNAQPAWWTDGLREVQRMRDAIEDEVRSNAPG